MITSTIRVAPHVLQLPALALASRFVGFATKILAARGLTPSSSTVDKARAIVGWFAENAVHPQRYLHPDGTTLNTDVLPAGETWATFNALFNQTSILNRDQSYWYSIFPDGITMLQRLIGTTTTQGVTSDDGMLTEYAAGQWRIRNFANFRAPQCTLQCKMAQVVMAAVGIHSFDISTFGHDPMAFYDDVSTKWLYIDPTYGEMQTLDGEYLTPLELLTLSLNGDASSIKAEKLPGAEYLASSYFTDQSAPHPNGMPFMTIHTSPQWSGGVGARLPYRFGDLPGLNADFDQRGTVLSLLPELGCGVGVIAVRGRTNEIKLYSSWPNHAKFQVSADDGVTWVDCASRHYRQTGEGKLRYRSVDATGYSGTETIIYV